MRLLLTAATIGLAGNSSTAAAPQLPDALAAGWQGKPVCELLHQSAADRVLRCTFPPGVGHERHFHPAHFGYALAGGQMRITTASGTRDVEIKPGASFASQGIAWHEVRNVGTTTVAYLIFEELVGNRSSAAPATRREAAPAVRAILSAARWPVAP